MPWTMWISFTVIPISVEVMASLAAKTFRNGLETLSAWPTAHLTCDEREARGVSEVAGTRHPDRASWRDVAVARAGTPT